MDFKATAVLTVQVHRPEAQVAVYQHASWVLQSQYHRGLFIVFHHPPSKNQHPLNEELFAKPDKSTLPHFEKSEIFGLHQISIFCYSSWLVLLHDITDLSDFA